jgi:hypothetical protein
VIEQLRTTFASPVRQDVIDNEWSSFAYFNTIYHLLNFHNFFEIHLVKMWEDIILFDSLHDSSIGPLHLTPFSAALASISVCFESGVGRDSAVGIATRYGLDGPGIESRWGRDFPHPSRPALGPTLPPLQWVPGLFPGGKAVGAWS